MLLLEANLIKINVTKTKRMKIAASRVIKEMVAPLCLNIAPQPKCANAPVRTEPLAGV